MAKPQFTCLMTCYEQEQYIYEALDSVLAQDYENIQLILIDDGSKVFHADKVKSYIDSHKGNNITDVIVEVNPQNLNAIKTYNKALPWVTGKYLNIFDGDDIYHDSHVVTQYVEHFETLPEASYVLCAQMLMCGKTFDEKLSMFCDPLFMDCMNKMSAWEQYITSCVATYYPKGSIVFRTELFHKIGPYDEDFTIIDDWPMILRILQAGHKIQYINFVACNHRFGGVSTQNRMTPRMCRFKKELVMVMDKYVNPYLEMFPQEKQKEIKAFYSESRANAKQSERALFISRILHREFAASPSTTPARRMLQITKAALCGGVVFLVLACFMPDLVFMKSIAKAIAAVGLAAAYGYLICKCLYFLQKRA